MEKAIELLRRFGVQATPQRIAVVDSVLKRAAHPTADEVLAGAKRVCPTVSRATVYNTLKLLVENGLLKTQVLREGTVVYDTITSKHHHFIDDETGAIYDIPWETLLVNGGEHLKDFEVREYQVIVRGRKKT